MPKENDSVKDCFFDQNRFCLDSCVAYVDNSRTHCRIINALEKLVPLSTRPILPDPPKV